MSLIAISDLTKRFPGVTALDSLSVEIEPGIVGLVGANGAGKSTLIKILLGLLPPTSGGAEVLGMDSRRDGIRIRAAVGYMPEHDCLPPDLTATDFVAHMGRMSGIPSDGARERTADVLRHCGLYEERYRQIGTYSTGMKQRVKLAQALVHDPRILFLDEPTNGLDPAGREEMLDLIRRTGTEFGITVVVSSHLLGEIERVCDFLVAIDAGRLLRAAPLASFTQLTDLLAIEVEDRHAELATLLASRGLSAEVDGSLVLVRMAAGVGDGPYDIVRDAVVDLDLPLIRMEQGRHSLEDLFRAEETEAGGRPMPPPSATGPSMPPPSAPGVPMPPPGASGGPSAATGPMTGGPA